MHTIKPIQQELFIKSYRENATELVRYAQSKIGDPEIGKDLVQDTFLKTWLYISRGREINNMKSFLYHSLKNLIVDRYRKQKTLSLDALLEYGYEPSVDDSERLLDILDGKVAIALLDKLPAMYQEILRMKYRRNLSLAEIARLTGKSKNNVAVCVYRGLSKLKALSSQILSGEGAVSV